jgi:hypothetical protein
MDTKSKRILACLAIPVAICVMLSTIWLLHNHYLSINHDGIWSSRLSRRAEARAIMGGLIAPFLAVLFAIVALLTGEDRDLN